MEVGDRQSENQGDRQTETERQILDLGDFEISNPPPSDTPHPTIPHLFQQGHDSESSPK